MFSCGWNDDLRRYDNTKFWGLYFSGNIMKIKKIFKCLSVAEITFDSDNASKNNQKSDDNAETAIDLKKHGRFKLEYERDNIVVAIKCFVKKCNRTSLARYIQNFVQFFIFRMKKKKKMI